MGKSRLVPCPGGHLRDCGCVNPFLTIVSSQWSLERRKNDFPVCPVVHKALTWDWGWGMPVDPSVNFENNQPFIKWVVKKYVNKNTQKCILYYTISLGQILVTWQVLSPLWCLGGTDRLETSADMERECTKPLCS